MAPSVESFVCHIRNAGDIHIFQGGDQILRGHMGALVIQFGFQETVYQQRSKADQEMCPDSLLFQGITEFFYGLCHNECPAAHAVEFPDAVGTEVGICTVNELGLIKHLKYLFFKRDGCELFARIPRVQAHGDWDPPLSMKSPISTMGLGRCSLLRPYFLRLLIISRVTSSTISSSGCSHSK